MALATRNVRDFDDLDIEVVDPWGGRMIATLDVTWISVPMRNSLGETCLRSALAQAGSSATDIQAFLDDAYSP